ncbi:hypothetical protein BKA65DRAFT_609523 [Rhexocercosporidium sp. MPI-PUGE-AT-0058]|nr:hypothetical protein BKA65DRAFT_609523 [Rhexocercosporidium sp. MPI-PUGE-AT-0058]
MSPSLWITLSTHWELGNVRAVLAFLINILLAIGLWIISYASWKHGAAQAARTSRVPLLSLLSMSGLGDAVDSLSVISLSMGLKRLAGILVQATAIVILSVAVIISGPIARYSTRRGIEVQKQDVNGWLATTNHSSMDSALVRWNNTIERLKSANFPTDQLLDFLPDNRVEWQYESAEWNSSWAVSCTWTPQTEIALEATGNSSGYLFDEVPGMRSVFPPETLKRGYSIWQDWGGAYEGTGVNKDVLLFTLAESDPELAVDENTGLLRNHQPLHLVLGAFHLHNVPRPEDPSTTNFGVGPIETSSYSMANCNIARAKGRTNDDLDLDVVQHIAFPWTLDAASTVSAFKDFHQAGIAEQSFNGEPIYLPSGEEMFRFYQAYMISKDTQYKQNVTRSISVEVPSVQLSVVALALLLLYVVFMAIVLLWAGLVMRVPKGIWIPRTKVEWMMQGVREFLQMLSESK